VCATLCTGDASFLAAWDLVRTSDGAVVGTVYKVPRAKRKARCVVAWFATRMPEVLLLGGKFNTAKYRVVSALLLPCCLILTQCMLCVWRLCGTDYSPPVVDEATQPGMLPL
jgi:hypothetical protein